MQTPCIHLCALDSETGFCAGCGRTLEEIGGWSSYSDAQRREIMAILPLRLTLPAKRRTEIAASGQEQSL
jgi:predicted Fe-S protein YdhL (DUF1289 family)